MKVAPAKEGDAGGKGPDEQLRRAGTGIFPSGFRRQIDDYLIPPIRIENSESPTCRTSSVDPHDVISVLGMGSRTSTSSTCVTS